MDYLRNLTRTLELIDAVYRLKQAYLHARHPEWSDEQIEHVMQKAMLRRKEEAWISRTTSSGH
ncbi:MAG: hypothetical protein HZC28_00200 [Spirochaetes bacterium]|nr:hypothetical protein [Spirochaetota bacterium]